MSQETVTDSNVADRVVSAWNEVIRARTHHQAVVDKIKSATVDQHEAHRALWRARERLAGSDELREIEASVSATSQRLTALHTDQRNAEIAVANAEIEHRTAGDLHGRWKLQQQSIEYQALFSEWAAVVESNRDLLTRVIEAARGELHWRSGRAEDVLTVVEIENLVRDHRL